MTRRLIALVAASASAPYLTSFFLNGHHLMILKPESMADAIESLLTNTLVLGSAALVIYGPSVFISAGILAGFLSIVGLEARTPAISLGAALGACFGLYLFLWDDAYTVVWDGTDMSSHLWPTLRSFIPSSAICGFIFWRIAIKRTPETPHAIAGP